MRLRLLGIVLTIIMVMGCSDDDKTTSETDGSTHVDASTDGQANSDSITPNPTTYSAAGSIGELISYTLDPNSLTYEYEIKESEFGLTGETASGTLIKNQDGTYTPSSDPDARVILLPNGLVIGAEDVDVNGTDRPLLFAGVPALASVNADELKGVYNYMEYSCDAENDPNCGSGSYYTSYGTVEIKTDNTFLACNEGNIEDQTNFPCKDNGPFPGTWADKGDGTLKLEMMGVQFATCMVMPSASGGKLIIVDMKKTTNTSPGLLVGVKKLAVANADLGGSFHFNGEDGNFGEVSVDNANNSYAGTINEPDASPLSYSGTLTRDIPWEGWLLATDETTQETTNILVFPEDGMFFNTSIASGKNTWIDIGGKL